MFEKEVDDVTTRDYIARVKTKKPVRYPPHMPQVLELKEAVAMPGWGLSIPVRSAKAKLSALLEMVSRGQEIVITSGGRPKAKVVPMESEPRRKGFSGATAHLRRMPLQTEGPFAEEIIRADRDGRGW